MFVLAQVSSSCPETRFQHDEDEAGRIDLRLMPSPPGAAARDVRAILLAREDGFFERLALAPQDIPHRHVADDDSARRKLAGERACRDLWLLPNAGK